MQAITIKGPFQNFSFSKVNREEIMKEIQSLSNRKASPESDIPLKIINQNSDLFRSFLRDSFKQTIEMSKFPNALKLTNITRIFKKGQCTGKGNYRQ